MQVSAGTRLGPYEIVAPVGVGGMGEVWRARDPRIGRDIAIKLLPPSVTENNDRLLRFEQEARAAGSLAHPNLITIHEFGNADGLPYIAMELLEGGTLRERLAQGPLPPRKAIEYAMQIASGLAAAHEKGVIHRDLKPENIFLTRDGRVKIFDFGLARLRFPAGAPEGVTLVRTSPGVVVGSAGYMSPEQVSGLEVDRRADVFALGTILYEMLSGCRAFRRDSLVETMNAILKDDPPPLDGNVPAALERIVFRCLEKAPEQRFDSAHDVEIALDALAAGTRSGFDMRRVGALALVPVIALVGIGAWFAGRATRRSPSMARNFTQLTFNFEEQPSIAPDAKSFAYVSSAAGEKDIYVQRIGGTNAINLTKGSGADNVQPAFSPDGQQIAFRSSRQGGGIFVMGATGESVRQVSDAGWSPSWSPDGKSLVAATEAGNEPTRRTGNSRLCVIDVATGHRQEIRSGDAVQPRWSPDGRRIAYWGLSNARRVIFTIPAGGGEPAVVVDDGALNWAPAWAPNGQDVFYSSDHSGSMNLWRIAIDDDGRPRAKPELVTVSPGWNSEPTVARDGTILFETRAGDGMLYALPFDPATMRVTGPPARAGNGSRRIFFADVSPDGQWITFTTSVPQEDIFVCHPDGSELRRLTNDLFKNRGPVWAPDGSRIAFFTNRGGNYDVWTVRPDGSDAQQITFGQDIIRCQWMPDGKRIVAFHIGMSSICIFDATPHAKIEWLPLPKSGPRPVGPASPSPDGRSIIFGVAYPEGERGLIRYDVAAKTWTPVSPTGTRAVWWDDSSLLFTDGLQLVHLDLKSGRRSAAGVIPEVTMPRLVLTSDHRTIYYISPPTESNIWMLRTAS